ncbi:MAG: PIN domain-containing protein [Treponema sp.]|jgi:predicted nucleic acid-binding protein|nr:PIN domain-containing protein [Treponema sp.]
MQNTFLIDSGPLIALFDRSDKYHKRVYDYIRSLSCHLVSTLAVLTEVSHMLDFSVEAQIDFLSWVMSGGLRLEPVERDDLGRIIELTRKYHDLPIDFADATLVLAAEKTGIRAVISIDSDFDIYRLTGKVRINNIFPG